MQRIVPRSNYDSYLSLARDADGHGALEIHIRTELRAFEPHNSSVPYAVYFTPTGTREEPGAYLVPWQGAFESFKRDFVRVVHGGWNGKLWLVHRSHDRAIPASHRRYRIGYDVPTVLKCRIRLTLIESDPQMVLLAGRVAPMGPNMRVYMCRAGGLSGRGGDGAGHSCGRLPFLNQEVADTRYHGRRGDFDGLITDRDVQRVTSTYDGVPCEQIPAVHEVGHYLGLHHVNRGPGVVSGSSLEYGRTAHQANDVMGRGSRVEAWHAWPWLKRLAEHLGQPLVRRSDGRYAVMGWTGTARDPWLAPATASA